MSYFSSPSIRENRIGHATVEVGEEELELAVTFDYHEWLEPHPYGSTTAYERLCEAVPIEFEIVGGKVLPWEDVTFLLGDAQAEQAIEDAKEQIL